MREDLGNICGILAEIRNELKKQNVIEAQRNELMKLEIEDGKLGFNPQVNKELCSEDIVKLLDIL